MNHRFNFELLRLNYIKHVQTFGNNDLWYVQNPCVDLVKLSNFTQNHALKQMVTFHTIDSNMLDIILNNIG